MIIFYLKKQYFTRKKCFYFILFILFILVQLKCFAFIRSFNKKYTDEVRVYQLYKQYYRRLNERGMTDISGRYKIAIAERRSYEFNDLTLVSQCSANHIPYIYALLKYWEGPISVAVYSELTDVSDTLWDLAQLMFCNKENDNLQVHIVVPFQEYFFFAFRRNIGFKHTLDCNNIPFAHSPNPVNYNWSSPYPINLLRNVAKKASYSDFVLVTDIDMVPSRNLRSEFLSFKQRNPPLKKELYVVPVFEVPFDQPIPTTKAEVAISYVKEIARPFYLIPCKSCHELTKYHDWISFSGALGVSILHEVEWQHPWEPFFISRRDVPDFDERFEQYGMNRISNICELYVAGYKFLVLSNVFLVHKGYKTDEGFHETKENDMETNRKLYAQFKVEMRYKYPNSVKQCHKTKPKSSFNRN